MATKNLWQRLFAVQCAVDRIGKDGENKFHKFAYASSSAVLSAVRAAMNEHGVICSVSILPETLQVRSVATKNEGSQECMTAVVALEWINPDAPEEKIVQYTPGMGLDAGERCVGKLLTYAEKYGILKQFHIPTDDADPDASQSPDRAPAQGGGTAPRQGAESGDMATDKQRKTIWAVGHKCYPGLGSDALKSRLADLCRAAALPEDSRDMTRKQASMLIETLDNMAKQAPGDDIPF